MAKLPSPKGLAQQIAQGRVPPALSGKRLISLDLVSMVAGTKYRGEFEERVKNLMDEAAAVGDIILFIDEIHNIIGAGAAEGSIDAANILKPQLSRGEIQLMGATTVAEYRRYIEKDSALERRFQKVNVEEPDDSQTVRILRGILPRYEQHHGVHITEEAVQAAVRLSRRYLNDRFLPDKAIDLMDEASAKVCQQSVSQPDTEYQQLDDRLHELREQKEAAILRQDFEQAAALRDQQAQTLEQLALFSEKLQKERRSRRKQVTANDIAQVVSESTGHRGVLADVPDAAGFPPVTAAVGTGAGTLPQGHRAAAGGAGGLSGNPPRPGRTQRPCPSLCLLSVFGTDRRRQNRAVQIACRAAVRLCRLYDPAGYVRIYGKTYRFPSGRFPAGLYRL